MGEVTGIEWCDHTFNPWIGCQKVSDGCDHCYAETLMDKRLKRVHWGPRGARQRTGESNWKQPYNWNRKAEADGVRRKVFCASLADWLDNKVPLEWRNDLCRLISFTPNLDWLLLTKRIENYERLSPWRYSTPPSNVWLGVTAENQEAYDRRWPILSAIPAPVRFISYEPALGPLSIRGHAMKPDWIICGGESGRGFRPMEEEWARSIRDQCERFNIPFFMKQMASKGAPPNHLMIREFPND